MSCPYCASTSPFDAELRALIRKYIRDDPDTDDPEVAVPTVKNVVESLAFNMSSVERLLITIPGAPGIDEIISVREVQIVRGVEHIRHHNNEGEETSS